MSEQQQRVSVHNCDGLDLMQTLPSGSVDLVLVDPPYGITNAKWDNAINFKNMWERIGACVKKNAAVCIFGSEPFSTFLRQSNIKAYKYDMYWVKNIGTGFLNAYKQPLRYVEQICVFYSAQPFYSWAQDPKNCEKNTQKKIKRNYSCSLYGKHDASYVSRKDDNQKCHKNVLYFDVPTHKTRVHNTQKPVDLLKKIIEMYTQEGETVLDFCMGSGSTGVACIETGRRFIGAEIDPYIYKIAQKRLDQSADKNRIDK